MAERGVRQSPQQLGKTAQRANNNTRQVCKQTFTHRVSVFCLKKTNKYIHHYIGLKDSM